MAEPVLVGLDWGTSSLRGYLLDGQGNVVRSKSASKGIMQVPAGGFVAVLDEMLAGLKAPAGLPIIASGMITSRQGWFETPYCRCPAGARELVAAMRREELPDGRVVHFVPGLDIVGEDGVPDVIRGEETQLIALDAAAGEAVCAVLPGTHSKWALIEDGRITWFATMMTGEVFAVLKEHSILGRLMTGEAGDKAAFARGLDYAQSTAPMAGGLLKRLFSARTLALRADLAETAVEDYLSGLLIGTELREAALCMGNRMAARPPVVIGNSALAERYREALFHLGLASSAAPADVAARGQFRLATAAGIIR